MRAKESQKEKAFLRMNQVNALVNNIFQIKYQNEQIETEYNSNSKK